MEDAQLIGDRVIALGAAVLGGLLAQGGRTTELSKLRGLLIEVSL
jgi:hypothetical protein